MRTKLFLSHAWEDKVAFVEPLYHALNEYFDVWYDKAVLTVGDSLLGKISEGLSNAEYGVVVLSPNFLRKQWTRAELDGLSVLEEVNRKVILPIWLNVEKDEVRKFSPILAAKVAIMATEPIPNIVLEIRRAVSVARQVASFSPQGH